MLNGPRFFSLYLYLSYVLFYFASISHIANQSVFIVFLYPSFAFILVNLLFSICNLKVTLNHFTITLIAFNFYIFMRSLLDVGDLSAFRKFTLNTSSSILFGFYLGYVALKTYELINRIKIFNVKHLLKYFNNIQIISIVYILILMYSSVNKMQSELFYTSEEGFYQRPGDLTIIYSILNYLIYSLLSDRMCLKIQLTRRLLIINNTLLIIYMQFIGSNAATFFLIVLIVYDFVKFINFKIATGRSSKYSYIIPLLSTCLLLVLFAYESIVGMTKKIRFFGFNVTDNNSLISRLNIVSDNAMTHFLYAPFWGNVNVDVVTSTEGAFIHSVFSVFFHLGIIGLLFVGYFFYCAHARLEKIPKSIDNKNIRSFLSFLYLIILLISVGFTFFSWSPLWFALTLINGIGKFEKLRLKRCI